ncbi:MAG: hypothetical protein O2971_09875 [Proteobacteria bacterium]|nr:hypothetical protein [Pseudomonadota bacterium]
MNRYRCEAEATVDPALLRGSLVCVSAIRYGVSFIATLIATPIKRLVPVLKSSLLLLFAWSLPLYLSAQTSEDLQDFNATYLEYVNTRESDPELAREAARRAHEIGARVFGETSERTAMLAINYAILLADEAASQDYLDEAVTIYQAIFGFGSAQLIDPLMRLGRTLGDGEQLRAAALYYNRALTLAVTHLGSTSSKAATIEVELGAIALRAAQYEEAYSRLSNARELLGAYSDSASQSNHARANLLLGDYFLATQQYQQAVQPLLAALASLSQYPHADVTLRNRIALIETYEKLGMREAATEHCLAIGSLRRVAANTNLRPLYTVTPGREQIDAVVQGQPGVRVSFTVDENGFVRSPQLLDQTLTAPLSAIFLQAVQKFRFAPRFVDGEAVATPNQQYVFR